MGHTILTVSPIFIINSPVNSIYWLKYQKRFPLDQRTSFGLFRYWEIEVSHITNTTPQQDRLITGNYWGFSFSKVCDIYVEINIKK
jgi:hypothetical protein